MAPIAAQEPASSVQKYKKRFVCRYTIFLEVDDKTTAEFRRGKNRRILHVSRILTRRRTGRYHRCCMRRNAKYCHWIRHIFSHLDVLHTWVLFNFTDVGNYIDSVRFFSSSRRIKLRFSN